METTIDNQFRLQSRKLLGLASTKALPIKAQTTAKTRNFMVTKIQYQMELFIQLCFCFISITRLKDEFTWFSVGRRVNVDPEAQVF